MQGYFLWPVALILAAAGCSESLQPLPSGEVHRTLTAGKPEPTDILFVVDNSSSMAPVQQSLARNFDHFVKVLAGARGDYQLAVVTTDVDSSGPSGDEWAGNRTAHFKNSPPYALASIDGSDCGQVPIQHGCFRGPDPSRRRLSSAALNSEAVIAAFKANVDVGSCGSGNEMGLGAPIRALERTKVGDCNDGFLRPNARLVVVIVSSEEDSDFPASNQGQEPYASLFAKPVGDYVARLASIKGAGKLRVATIVGATNGEAQRCGRTPVCGGICDQPPPAGSGRACTPGPAAACPAEEYCDPSTGCQNKDWVHWTFCWWCSVYSAEDCCFANAGGRYVDFALAAEVEITRAAPGIPTSKCRAPFGTRAACWFDSIGEDDLAGPLRRIARELAFVNELTLDPPANDAAGVQVKLNGKQLTRCTSHDQDDCAYTVYVDDAVRGRSISVPGVQEGDQVELIYASAT